MKKFRSQRGAAAVELALVLPLLCTILFGIIEAGRYYNQRVTLTHAAREGARVLALTNDSSLAQDRVTGALNGMTGYTPTWSSCPSSPGPADAAAVTLVKPFTFTIPFVTAVLPNTISTTGSMRCNG